MRRHCKKLIASIALSLMLFNSAGLSFAETSSIGIGSILNEPEKGWTRFKENTKGISFLGNSWNSGTNNGATDGYITATCGLNDEYRFNFTGNKIRILTPAGYDASSQLIIDGSIIRTSKSSTSVEAPTIRYQELSLPNGIHSVRVINLTQGVYISPDAIDIGEGEKILPYDESVNNNNTTTGVVLNIEPDKTKIKTTEKVVANLTIDNIKEIAAEDIRVKYDAQKLKYDGTTEVDGFKLVKNDEKAGELRFIVASKGNANIVSSKKTLLQLGFTGIAPGEAKVDVIKGRVSDGIEMEKDLTDEQCGEATILIEQGTMLDVNNSGAFTLLDLAIDARHLNKDPKSEELKKYNTDIVLDNAINDNDLSEIGRLMLENPDYKF